ncbi:MAG TPA: metal ABC transporter substrate-binding protein [Dehalococcoidia bacterium]|nr:metal ABC transporter substrate-binding protein [Dehalococcoidia bacterium]
MLIIFAAACSDEDDDNGDDTSIRVVTSLPLITDMVENVAGGRAEVDSLLPPGADPHTYEPSPNDVRKVAEAEIAFANGLSLEPGAMGVIEANLPSGAALVELAEVALEMGVEPIEGDHDPSDEGDHYDEDEHADEEDEHAEEEDDHGKDAHDHEGGNPHLWLDPVNGALYAEIIRDTLIDADPDGRADYEENYAEYAATLSETATHMTEATSGVPEEHRKIVSTHDAFDYMARAIGFEVAGFVAPGPGQEPSPADIAELIETIQNLGVPAVFAEPQTDAEARTLEQIADEAGAEVCTLYSDSFSEDVSTYVDILRFNADELARCLGGDGG